MFAYVCAWLFVFAVPWEDVIVLPGLGTLSKLLGIAAFGVTALRVLLTAKVRRPVSFHWVAFAYLCWVLLSASWAVNTYCSPVFGCSVRNAIDSYLRLFVMVWVLWEATPTRSRLMGLLQAYVFGAYVAAAGTIYNFASGAAVRRTLDRFAANGFDPNDLGMLLALAMPIAWYIGSSSSSTILRWVNRGYFLLGSVAILLTGSRGGLLAMLVALSVIPWTMTQVRRSMRIAAVALMFVAGIAAALYVPARSFERLASTESEISQGDMTGRWEIWKAGIAAVPARPLQGYGPAGWEMALSHRLGIKGPHNTYLAILVDEGLIGLVLFLVLLLIVLKRLLPLPVFERRVTLALLATLATAIMPLAWDTKKALWLILGMLLSCSAVMAPTRRTLPSDAVAKDPAYGPVARRPRRGMPRPAPR
jgi:O-antigen ligase